MPFGAKPQSVDGGRRSQYAQPNHSQPACKLQVRADGRDCPYRQAWLSACPHWQAQQARRPSTQSPKHLAAQPSSASERQDKEAACGPHYGMDSIAHRWYRSGEGPVFARPVLQARRDQRYKDQCNFECQYYDAEDLCDNAGIQQLDAAEVAEARRNYWRFEHRLEEEQKQLSFA